MEQVRRIVINGIKCFERKVKESRMEGGRRLHRTAGESSAGRVKKKLLGKSEWFKTRKRNQKSRLGTTSSSTSSTIEVCREQGWRGKSTWSKGSKKNEQEGEMNLKTRTVLFIAQTKMANWQN